MEHIGYGKGRVARKPWVTTEMLETMKERRKWKSRNTEMGKKKYRQLNNELRRDTEKAKAIWWEVSVKSWRIWIEEAGLIWCMLRLDN